MMGDHLEGMRWKFVDLKLITQDGITSWKNVPKMNQNDLELSFHLGSWNILQMEILQNVPNKHIEMKNKIVIVLICRG